jgi:hypothetical protein
MPSGHNGPWNHVDTAVRTTAHWAIAFNKAFEVTGDSKWKAACLKSGDYLISPAARPFNASFYCRVDPRDDSRKNNGLIGQAWAIEALIELGKKHQKEEYLRVATEVVNLHQYSFVEHGWKNLLVDGRNWTFDRTVNQQVWFSYVASLLSDRSLHAKVASRDFFSHISQHIEYHDAGTIRHVTGENPSRVSRLKSRFLDALFPFRCDPRQEQLALGYQSFILVAIFNYLRENGSDRLSVPFLERALQFSLDKANAPLYENNAYCYGYNVTGIELAIVAESLGDFDAAAWWLNQQFGRTRGPAGRYLSANVSDPVVVQSRIYEIYRLQSDYEIAE